MILLFFFISYWLGLSFRYCWYIFLLLILGIVFLLFKKYKKKFALISLSIFLLGVGVSFIKIENPKKQTFQGIVYEVKDNYFLFSSGLERLYVYEKNTNREIGDILEIKGKEDDLSFTTLESGFDFEDYLNKKGVYHSLTISKITSKFECPLQLHRIRKFFLDRFQTANSSILSSILFSESFNSELDSSIRNLHLGKFLSANGTYIYIFLSVFAYLFHFLLKEKWAEIGSLAVLSLYLIFVFPKFSVIRIFVLFIARWINKYLLKGKFDHLTVNSFIGVLFLLIDPFLARQASFILGFLVPIAMSFINEAIKGYKKITKKLLPILLLYVFLIPFELDFYNSISPLSMIFSIVLAPIFILIGIMGLICFFKIPLYTPLNWVCGLLKNICGGLEKINLTINAPKMSPILIFIYYLLFFLLLYYLKLRFKPVNRGIIITQLTMLSLYFLPINNTISQQVTFINVGQGDACLIRNKNSTVLIDTGGLTYSDIATDCLIPYFRKNRIYDIDIVITTHDDFDHSGGLSSLITNYKVRSYLNKMDDFPFTYKGVTFKNYNKHVEEFDDENSKSLVIGFAIGGKDYLIMGDATTKIENLIMEENKSIPCDILKVGHHGSDTSSSYKFLKFINPKEAVISVGKNNSYHLPSPGVIENLKKLQIPTKRTDYLGSITYKNFIFNA